MSDVLDIYMEYVRDEYEDGDSMVIEILSDEQAMDCAERHGHGIIGRFHRGGYSFTNDGKWRCAADYFKKEAGTELIFGDGFSMRDIIDEVEWDEINGATMTATDKLEDIKSEIDEFLNDARTNNLQGPDFLAAIEEWMDDLRHIAITVSEG